MFDPDVIISDELGGNVSEVVGKKSKSNTCTVRRRGVVNPTYEKKACLLKSFAQELLGSLVRPCFAKRYLRNAIFAKAGAENESPTT